jgi:hypothetical protein
VLFAPQIGCFASVSVVRGHRDSRVHAEAAAMDAACIHFHVNGCGVARRVNYTVNRRFPDKKKTRPGLLVEPTGSPRNLNYMHDFRVETGPVHVPGRTGSTGTDPTGPVPTGSVNPGTPAQVVWTCGCRTLSAERCDSSRAPLRLEPKLFVSAV